MKIKFSENGSRIYDFFRLFANKQTILDRRKEDNGTNDICYSLLLSMIDKAGSLAEELEFFYYPECFFWWDFLPYFYYSDYSKEEDLLDDISACDRKKLRGMILSYLLYMSKGIFIDKAKELLPYMKEAEKNGVFELLDELSISNMAKWSQVPSESADCYRNVEVAVISAGQVVRDITLPDAFVMEYSESLDDESGVGEFYLHVKQKKDIVDRTKIDGGFSGQ